MENINIIKRITNKEVEEFASVCPFCKKRIVGSTEGQVAYNMLTHIKAKHKDKNEN